MEKNFKKGERVWIWYQSFIPPTYGDYIFVQATIIEREYDAESLYPEEKYIIRADSGADGVQSAEYIYRTKEEAQQGLIEYFEERVEEARNKLMQDLETSSRHYATYAKYQNLLDRYETEFAKNES